MAVDNYLYRYSDGSTGNSPYRRDASGNIVLNSAGGIADEGSFLGRSMQDGSVNQSPIGNVTTNGMVDTYGGYQSSAADYYGNGNEAAWGRPSNAGAAPAAGYGTAPAGGQPGAQTGGASFGGSGSGAGASPSASPGGSLGFAGQNPYLGQMGQVMTGQMTDAFNTSVMPQVSSQAMAAGGYGGSRQGVIEANAMNDLGKNMASGLTNLYGQGYNNSLNYDLGLRNNELGFGNLGLGYANLDRTINNDNLGWQMQGANLGLGMYDRLQQGNQAGITAGTNIHNTPMNNWSQFSNQANSFGQGYGTTTGNTNSQGNPIMGALGGAQLGSQLGNLWGGSPNATGGSNSSGWGTGSGYGNQDYGSYF